jgi:hypothetical protein
MDSTCLLTASTTICTDTITGSYAGIMDSVKVRIMPGPLASIVTTLASVIDLVGATTIIQAIGIDAYGNGCRGCLLRGRWE